MSKIAVIGFQVWNAANNKPLSRRYNVRAAAEQYHELAVKEYPQAYVQEVMGPAEAPPPILRRGKRAA